MLALAHYVERLIEAGELSGYAEAAQVFGVTRAPLTQVVNLPLLTFTPNQSASYSRSRSSRKACRLSKVSASAVPKD